MLRKKWKTLGGYFFAALCMLQFVSVNSTSCMLYACAFINIEGAIAKADETMRRSPAISRFCCLLLFSLPVIDAQWPRHKSTSDGKVSEKHSSTLLNLIRSFSENEQRLWHPTAFFSYMPYKQNGTTKVLPLLVIPMSGLAHRLLQLCWCRVSVRPSICRWVTDVPWLIPADYKILWVGVKEKLFTRVIFSLSRLGACKICVQKCAFLKIKLAISRKRWDIEPMLLLITNRKWHTPFQMR